MSLGLFRRAAFWWIAFAVILVLRILLRPESHSVFPIFAAGSANWWSDSSLYLDREALDAFRYPPPFAIAFSPCAWLGPRVGGVLWALTSLGVYWLGLRRFWFAVRVNRAHEDTFLVLSLIGAVAGLWNGQSNALLVGLLLLGAAALVQQRWWTAALFLGLPVVLKFTPLPLVLLLVAFRPRQLAPRLLVVVLAGGLLPFATRSADVVGRQYQGWTTHLTDSSTKRWPGFRDGWTIIAVARHLIDGKEGMPDLKEPLDEPAYRVVQILSGLALFVWTLVLRRRGMDARKLVLVTLAGGACWLLLLGPASEAPTYVFLAPFLAWGLVERRWWPGARRLIEGAGILLLVVGWSELTRSWWNEAPWLILALPAGVILFWVWLVVGPARVGAVNAHSRPDSGPADSLPFSRQAAPAASLRATYRAALPYACRRSSRSPA
jgi:hypothetical protein